MRWVATMKKAGHDLNTEVRELMKQTLVAESNQVIWDQFGQALSQLDKSTVRALKHYFNGATRQQISQLLDLTEKQTDALVARGKQQLIEILRRNCKVRQ